MAGVFPSSAATRRAANGERANGIADLVEGAEVALNERPRQTPLVDNAHRQAVRAPVDSPNRLHAIKLATGPCSWERTGTIPHRASSRRQQILAAVTLSARHAPPAIREVAIEEREQRTLLWRVIRGHSTAASRPFEVGADRDAGVHVARDDERMNVGGPADGGSVSELRSNEARRERRACEWHRRPRRGC